MWIATIAYRIIRYNWEYCYQCGSCFCDPEDCEHTKISDIKYKSKFFDKKIEAMAFVHNFAGRKTKGYQISLKGYSLHEYTSLDGWIN